MRQFEIQVIAMFEEGKVQGHEAVANMVRKKKFKYILIAEGALIGLITGVLISLFRLMLTSADNLRGMITDYVEGGGILPAIVCVSVLLAISTIVSVLLKWEPDIAGSGIPQVEAELRGLKDMKWWSAPDYNGCFGGRRLHRSQHTGT